jgi:hypothetical protein
MIIKKDRNIDRNSVVDFCKSVITMERNIKIILDIWNKYDPNNSYEEELEESPWMTSSMILFTEFEEPYANVMGSINKFQNIYESFGNSNTDDWCWRVYAYFSEGAGFELNKMISFGNGCDDNAYLNQHRITLEKSYRYLTASIHAIFEVDKIIAGEEIPELLTSAGQDCNVDILSYCRELNLLKNNMPVSVNSVVNENMTLINSQLENYGADREVFLQYSSAVMPYDIVAMRNNDLILDSEYVKRLIEREENPFSLYNTAPQIYDICGMIPQDYAVKFYKYEPYIKDTNIVAIRDGKDNVKSLLDSFDKDGFNISEAINDPTVFF